MKKTKKNLNNTDGRTMKYYLIPVTMAIIIPTKDNKCCPE